jgi:hypothetical protein
LHGTRTVLKLTHTRIPPPFHHEKTGDIKK